jgi:hypothetical protein
MRTRRLARPATALLAGLALALAGCGDSAEDTGQTGGGGQTEDTAQTQVCDARADIGRQIDELQALDRSTVTVDGVRGNLEAIRKDLQTIRGAQADLGEDRRAEVKAANDAFATQVRQVGATLLRSTSVEEARTSIATAVGDLGSSYRETLATVDCG